MLYFLFIVLAILGGVAIFMQQPQFGKQPSGERLKRILASPQYKNGAFQNLSHTPDLAEGVSYWDILKAYFKTIPDKEPKKPIPFVKRNLHEWDSDSTSLVWFGHSSYLIHTHNKNILIDPVFSGNASPVSFFGKNYAGSNEYKVEDLPEIDLLIITHDHYDHLDYETIVKLRTKVKQVITSLGVGEHLVYWGYDEKQITELDWWESSKPFADFTITATPARHFSGRKFTRNQSLWSSFVLQTPSVQLYLGGDSGYDSHFKAIGEKFGSFDLALLECGQYNYFWKYIHMIPEETAQAALDLHAKVLMPVHWSKFTLALHPWYEPIERVTKAATQQNLPYTTPKIGEKIVLGSALPQTKWWTQP